jgi:hypothetical protein
MQHQLDPQTLQVVKEVLAGTPDAARSEPFTWIMGLIILCIIGIALFAGRRLIADFMDFIAGQNAVQREMQVECHKQSDKAMDTVQKIVEKSNDAMHTHSRSMDGHTRVMERVIDTLNSRSEGGPGS